MVYYFAGYFQATTENAQSVSFSVPSGNFGNVCAGHVARMMGLPVSQLVVATNENDVLDEFFKSGSYQVRDSANTFETSSPSMDISKASNFERFIYDFLKQDSARTADLFHQQLSNKGAFNLSAETDFVSLKSRYGFVSGKSTHEDRLRTIRRMHSSYGQVVDPHTADGLKVALEHMNPGEPMIVLETALPVKFADTIMQAIQQMPQVPHKFKDLESLPLRFEVMPPDLGQVKKFIEAHCNS